MLGSPAAQFLMSVQASETASAPSPRGLGTEQGSIQSAPIKWAPSIPEEQYCVLAYLQKGEHIVSNSTGVFVPATIFGQTSRLAYRIEAGDYGPQVIVFDERGGARPVQSAKPKGNHQLERDWLSAHRSTHAGMWVALSGNRLLAAGCKAPDVYNKARELGIPAPFVAFVGRDEELPFAGW